MKPHLPTFLRPNHLELLWFETDVAILNCYKVVATADDTPFPAFCTPLGKDGRGARAAQLSPIRAKNQSKSV